ncbi:hypothetical protein GIB67_033374 [Kingdonia uniflora]|uniref:SWIM-type domain-containing protein n=1 Tax=Kingdonia uniflora TaxID=39325 RepID=A0A7J7LTN6_9MAGN|nr:hypothetical protein GIB67_033374 [Kingdonia uniflora]
MPIIQEAIWIKYGVDVSYSTTWNAWTICMERIVGSYDEGYILMPELTVQVLLANHGSISTCSIDLMTNEWTGTCISYKGSMERWLNGCRPVLGLDGCFLKGKYGLVPRAITHIEKMSKKYGQYRVEGTIDKCFVVISGSGQKWKVNLDNFECQCREWQLTGLPCVHAVCVLIPMGHPWIEYCSEYHTDAKYVAIYNLPIHAIDDPSEWGHPGYTVLSPPLVRGPGRPKKQKIKDQNEVLGNCRRCRKSGALGHMKKTCKGSSAQPSGTSTRQMNKLDTNSSRAEHRRNVGAPSLQTPIVRGRGRCNSARGGRGRVNLNNESGTSTNTGRGNGKNMGRATATRGRGTATKIGNNATANTRGGATSNTGRGAASNIGMGATSNIGRGTVSNNGRVPFQLPIPATYVATQSSQTISITNPYKKAYQTPTRNWKP